MCWLDKFCRKKLCIAFLLVLSAIGSVFTASIIRLNFSPDMKNCENLFWGVSGCTWKSIHWYFSLVMAILAIILVIMNWNFIIEKSRKAVSKEKKTAQKDTKKKKSVKKTRKN